MPWKSPVETTSVSKSSVRQPELALGEVEVAVHGAGVDDRDLPDRARSCVVEEVGVEPYLDVRVVGHPLEPRGVAVDGQALPGVVEVAVVVRVAHRQAGDDLGGQVARDRSATAWRCSP